jgi:hypothetical protein
VWSKHSTMFFIGDSPAGLTINAEYQFAGL